MSPEQRACDLMNRYSLVWGLETASDRGLQSMIEAIATAIREAEDAAYERAAELVELWMTHQGAHPINTEIRSLKSQEP